jgi:hypothetical protein
MVRYEDMTVEQLKERLRDRGLPVSGAKAVLTERLRSGRSPSKSPTKSRGTEYARSSARSRQPLAAPSAFK